MGYAHSFSVHAAARYDPAERELIAAHVGEEIQRVTIADPLRESGIARPRSAAETSIFSGLVAKALRGEHEQQTAVILLTTTSTVDVCFAFEQTGLREQWDLVDPFALPHAIPSAGATCVSKILDADAGALVLIGGYGSLGLALDFAGGMLGREADRVILIASEQRLSALHAFTPARRVGAIGLDLRASGRSLVTVRQLADAAGCDETCWTESVVPVGSSVEALASLFSQLGVLESSPLNVLA